MATKYRCKACGKEDLTGENGAKGHVKFSGGDHGDRMELPDDWKSLVTPMDEENNQTPNPSDDGNDEPTESDGDDEQASTPRESEQPTETTGTLSRVKKAVTDDVRHLWGGAK